MNMFDEVSTLQMLAWVGYLVCLFILFKKLPARQIVEDKKIQHLVFGSTACVIGLWLFRTGIHEGLHVHFLWLTALCLTLGLRWALVSGTLALLSLTIIGKDSWAMFGVNGLFGVVVPLVLTYLIYSLSFHRLPKHFLVYVFICAFLPGGLMIAVKMTLLGSYYYFDNIYSWQTVKDNYLILIQLLAFPEAMFNGMTMVLLIIYKPHWVYTFYDKFYLNDKK